VAVVPEDGTRAHEGVHRVQKELLVPALEVRVVRDEGTADADDRTGPGLVDGDERDVDVVGVRDGVAVPVGVRVRRGGRRPDRNERRVGERFAVRVQEAGRGVERERVDGGGARTHLVCAQYPEPAGDASSSDPREEVTSLHTALPRRLSNKSTGIAG